MTTRSLMTALGLAAALGLGAAVHAVQAQELSGYTVKDLLEPCVEGDNNSRWGAAAEAECEQYIKGFTDAYVMMTDGGKADDVCLPAQNRPDEIRWAFMKWAHRNFDQRGKPAGDGLLATMKADFTCD